MQDGRSAADALVYAYLGATFLQLSVPICICTDCRAVNLQALQLTSLPEAARRRGAGPAVSPFIDTCMGHALVFDAGM